MNSASIIEFEVELSIIAVTYAECHYAECRYAECHYAECRYAECHYAECNYAECLYAECHYAECRYAECRYEECRGADSAPCCEMTNLRSSLFMLSSVELEPDSPVVSEDGETVPPAKVGPAG